MADRNVIVHASTDHPYCRTAKQYLEGNEVAFSSTARTLERSREPNGGLRVQDSKLIVVALGEDSRNLQFRLRDLL